MSQKPNTEDDNSVWEMKFPIKYNIQTTNLWTSTNLVMKVGMNGYM